MPSRKPWSALGQWTEDGRLTVDIETPKGSRNKFSFDEKRGVFQLKKVLPAGMRFPYDFGVIPRTVGGDGDPVDDVGLMEEPAFSECVLTRRLLGVNEGEAIEGGKTDRNDRLIGIEDNTH